MAGTFQPLSKNFNIVNPDGTPTEYFIRWAQEKQIDIGKGITAEQAQKIVEDWSSERQIIAENGVTGGGPLSSDVTLSADVQAILDQISNQHGSILFKGASGWQTLPPGTSGQFLKTNGASADPSWANGGGGGGGGEVGAHRYWGLFDINASSLYNAVSIGYISLKDSSGALVDYSTATATASSQYNSSEGPNNALKDDSTHWATASGSGIQHWFVIDLGEGKSSSVSEISVRARYDSTWYVQTARLFLLCCSDDMKAWLPVCRIMLESFTGSGNTQTSPVPLTWTG